MAASFPTTKKTFSAIVNGVTKLVALLFNTNYDETEAVQTYLGASGNAQSKLAALNLLFKYQLGAAPTITWIDADTLEISSRCVLMHSGANYVIKHNTEALQVVLSENLDTGSEAASTLYDVFLIGDGASTTYTAQFVVSGNTPSGATYYKKIGTWYNDGSSNLMAGYQTGDKFTFDDPYGNATLRILNGATSASFADVTCICPATAVSVDVCGICSSAGTVLYLKQGASGATGGYPAAIGANGDFLCENIPVASTKKIQYKIAGGTTVTMYQKGYTLNLA